MAAATAAIAEEQDYFDRAVEARERELQALEAAPSMAAHSAAAAGLRKKAKEVREEVDRYPVVADASFTTDDNETWYLGRHAVKTEDHDLLVVSWKSSVASAYYEATVDSPHGVLRKRTFVTDGNTVLDFDEVVLAELADRVRGLLDGDPGLLVDDALLRDLERQRTGEMADIVQTITAAQYNVIRKPLDRLLVVQGGPGTGKTAIALHRVSWLLYNHEQLSADRILVVGPNPVFSRYIRQLLPSLGDVDVVQSNLRHLGPVKGHGEHEDLAVAALKSDARMVGLITRGLAARVRLPSPGTPWEVTGSLSVPYEEVVTEVEKARQAATYAGGRIRIRQWLQRRVDEIASTTRTPPTPAQIDLAIDRIWPSLSPAAFIRDLLGSRDRLLEAAGADFNAAEINQLYRQSADRVSEERWTDTDVALLDEADWLINGSSQQYQHIVVDEAQDLTPMQLRSLARRSADGSMTLVGDLAQSTGPWAHTSWEDVVDHLAQEHVVEYCDLRYGYRVPRQIMEFAAALLPHIALDVDPPVVVRTGPEDPDLQRVDVDDDAVTAVRRAREYASQGLSVGVICPGSLRHEVVEVFQRQGVQWRDGDKGDLGLGINLVSPSQCKGLEFDAAVVVSPRHIRDEDEHGLRLLYIALTRTTRHLTVVFDDQPLPLPPGDESPTRPAIDAATETDQDVTGPVVDLTTEAATSRATGEGAWRAATTSKDSAQPTPARPSESVGTATTAEAPSSAVPAPNAYGEVAGLDLSAAVVATASSRLAAAMRSGVSEQLWARTLDALRRELGVPGEDLLDLMD